MSVVLATVRMAASAVLTSFRRRERGRRATWIELNLLRGMFGKDLERRVQRESGSSSRMTLEVANNQERIMKNYIGIDVAKDKVDIFSLKDSKYLVVANNEESLTEALKKFDIPNCASSETLIVLENTGGYERTCIKAALKLNFKLHRTDNNKFNKFAGFRGKKAKTDKIAARKLALYGKDGYERNDPEDPFRFYNPRDDGQEKFKQLSQYLRALIGERTRASSRLKSPGCAMISDHVNKTLDNLEAQISSVEDELEELIKSDEDMKDKFDAMIDYSGVAEKTATRLLANFPELGTVSKGEISAIAGLAPHANISGKKIGNMTTKGSGRSVTKEILYWPACSAIRHNKEMKVFYNRLLSKGKKKMMALVAVMRKMLVQLNAILRKELKRKEAKVGT